MITKGYQNIGAGQYRAPNGQIVTQQQMQRAGMQQAGQMAPGQQPMPSQGYGGGGSYNSGMPRGPEGRPMAMQQGNAPSFQQYLQGLQGSGGQMQQLPAFSNNPFPATLGGLQGMQQQPLRWQDSGFDSEGPGGFSGKGQSPEFQVQNAANQAQIMQDMQNRMKDPRFAAASAAMQASQSANGFGSMNPLQGGSFLQPGNQPPQGLPQNQFNMQGGFVGPRGSAMQGGMNPLQGGSVMQPGPRPMGSAAAQAVKGAVQGISSKPPQGRPMQRVPTRGPIRGR